MNTRKKSSEENSSAIEMLNNALQDELGAIHQYLYFHFHCDDQGLGKLAGIFKAAAMGEMRHTEKLADRILFLKGELKMDAHKPVKLINVPREMLAEAAAMEKQSTSDYNRWANECTALQDLGSREVFESLIKDEERHYDTYTKELDNLDRFGDQYLALQTLEPKEA